MRILYVDIDSLRPDHLGCYGYHRNTSPHIDAIAERGVRFNQMYISDAPCLPSRTALWSGRFGFCTGVVNHGGVAGQPFIEGPDRKQRDVFYHTGWMQALRQVGLRTATVSSFGDRHSAWHWYAGFDEIYNPGGSGNEPADQVAPIALDWLRRNGRSDNWFLHVNFWDPHTPYNAPIEYGNPFEGEPLPAWLTEDVWRRFWEGYGPHSPQEPHGFGPEYERYFREMPRVPEQLDSMDNVHLWMDGYDTGIRYADDHVGQLLNTLADLNILDETVIIISADHGENQGELNVWGDHQTADMITCRVPLIVHFPGIKTQQRTNDALHYQFDWAATLIELVGGRVPENWQGQSFAAAFEEGSQQGRDFLVLSQQTWACQRSVRFDNYLCMRTYHDGYKQVQPMMLFDVVADPHEQNNLTQARPDIVNAAMKYLADWQEDMIATSFTDVDPMMTVIREGGPYYTKGHLPAYLERLRNTGRAHHAETLAKRHPNEL